MAAVTKEWVRDQLRREREAVEKPPAVPTMNCPECGGKGELRVSLPSTKRGPMWGSWGKCGRCDGHGRVVCT